MLGEIAEKKISELAALWKRQVEGKANSVNRGKINEVELKGVLCRTTNKSNCRHH